MSGMGFLDAGTAAKKMVFTRRVEADDVEEFARMVTSSLALQISKVFHSFGKISFLKC